MGSFTSHALDGIDLIGPHLDGCRKYLSAVAVADCVYAPPCNASQVMRIKCKTGDVQHIGPQLHGDEKYCSAVAVGDCVYAVPCFAKQVLRISCKTDEVQHIGPHLDGDEKYSFAVAVGDCVYAAPCHAKQVLRINCKTGDVQHIGPQLNGDWKYCWAIAVGDCVFAAPCNAKQVLRINCKTGDVQHIGPQLNGDWKYLSALAVGDCVYAVPCHAKQVLRINCKTGDVQHIGPQLNGDWKYLSALAVGDCVYAAPFHAKQVMRINCKTGDVQHIGPQLNASFGGCEYQSAVAVGDCVFAAPCNAKQVLRINCKTGDVQQIGPQLHIFADPMKYLSTVAVDDCVYALPYNAKQVLCINCKASPGASPQRHLRWAEGVEAPAAGMRLFYPSGFSVSLDVPEAIAQFGHTADQIRAILAAGEKKASTSPMAISKEHSAALYAYTEDSPLYRQLNYAMRTPSTPSNPTDNQLKLFADYIFHAERALNCMPTHVSSIAGPVFRGMNTLLNPAIYAPGKRITWQAFTSSTRKQAVTLTFLDKLPGRKLQGSVFVIQSSTAKDISFFSEYPHEEEVVFAPNSGFRVEKVLRTEGEKQSVLSDLAAYDMSDLDVYLLHQVA